MFLHDCILNKNTPEIRNKLIEIGYEPFIEAIKDSDKSIITVSRNGKGPYFITYTFLNEFDEYGDDDYIRCGTNYEKFLAIAAIRDDSDFMQWFIEEIVEKEDVDSDEKEKIVENWVLYTKKCNAVSQAIKQYAELYGKKTVHKATIKEIFDKFK